MMDPSLGAMFCVDLRSRDGQVVPPKTVDGGGKELFEWFQSSTEVDLAQIRILCLRIDDSSNIREILQSLDTIFSEQVIKHAIWKPDVYHMLTGNVTGGASGLLNPPVCFVLQTPLDGGPFCSMALSVRHHVVKGIYLYDHDDFDPRTMKGGEASRSGWRSSGLQIITLAEMFLQAHSTYVSQLLPNLIAKVSSVEAALVRAGDDSLPDFNALGRMLHACHSDLVDLERRSRFEETVVAAIETVTAANQHGQSPWPSLAPVKTAVISRKFDFESLPRRIDNCRATMNSLMQRHNEQLNLELTQASHQIAEAALQDSKSMKTIAILTMVLLPGTAVASLFSMSMFNWTAKDGNAIASKWLWLYFVISVPLTGCILVIWWLWSQKSDKASFAPSSSSGRLGRSRFKDEEAATAQLACG